MVDWNDIKKAFDRDYDNAQKKNQETEQKLLTAIADYICTQKGISTLHGYHPEDISAFLTKPVSEIKTLIGGEWKDMDDDKLELLIYTLAKKVKKSESLLEW